VAKPRVLLLATGGTISMQVDRERGGAVPRLSGREILESIPGVAEVARVEVREFGRLPGPHVTIERMWEMRAAVLAALDEDTSRDDVGRPDLEGEFEPGFEDDGGEVGHADTPDDAPLAVPLLHHLKRRARVEPELSLDLVPVVLGPLHRVRAVSGILHVAQISPVHGELLSS